MSKHLLLIALTLLLMTGCIPASPTAILTAQITASPTPPAILTITQPPTATPPQSTASPTPPQTIDTPSEVVPILTGFYIQGVGSYPAGLLLGGVQGTRWLPAAQIHLAGGEIYQLYSATTVLGIATGGKPFSEQPTCSDDLYVEVDPLPNSEGILYAIGGEWNALPRPIQMLPLDEPAALQLATGWLNKNGIETTNISLQQHLQADLDEDGVSESLLAISAFTSPGLPSVSAGDYTAVLLISGDTTLPVIFNVYNADQAPAAANRYSVAALLDLNGDGSLEIILTGSRFEGMSIIVYQYNDRQVRPALVHDCGYYPPAQPLPDPQP